MIVKSSNDLKNDTQTNSTLNPRGSDKGKARIKSILGK